MHVLYFVLLLLSAVAFTMSALNMPTRRVNMLAVGLLLWVLVDLLKYLLHL